MEQIIDLISRYSEYAWSYLTAVINPDSRLFVGFLLVSLGVVLGLYLKRAKGTGIKEFIFPKFVWSHPTAWLDVRYFFFHGLIAKFFIKGIGVVAFFAGLNLGIGNGAEVGLLEGAGPDSEALRLIYTAMAMVMIIMVTDFCGFYLHYLQHKIPVLWQFHKVHHCGEVMHPLSNYREHPVDNLTYDLFINLVTGLMLGLLIGMMKYNPDFPTLAGYSIAGLAFNSAAYSLRHSHIWLRWPGNWSKIFGSPAHHQVHHSRHPDHLDKNFAFMFPIWDVLFKTYEMPEDNRNVEFGIVEDSSDMNSCWSLYWVPFRDAYRVVKSGPKDKPEIESISVPDVSLTSH